MKLVRAKLPCDSFLPVICVRQFARRSRARDIVDLRGVRACQLVDARRFARAHCPAHFREVIVISGSRISREFVRRAQK